MTHSGDHGVARRGTRHGSDPMSVMVAVALGLAAVWAVVALRLLASAIAHETADHVAQAGVAFQAGQQRTADELRAEVRALAADPRLVEALAAEPEDLAVLTAMVDPGGRRRGDAIAVIAAEGSILAQSGVDELRGVDLLGSRTVRSAQSANDAVADTWVIGDRVVDIAIAPVRSASELRGFLLIGQELDAPALRQLADQTGVAAAMAIGDVVTLTSPGNVPAQVVAAAAGSDPVMRGQRLDLRGESYIVSAVVIPGPDESPRLILAQSLAPARQSFTVVRWMLYLPSLLVLIAAAIARIAHRLGRVAARSPAVIAAQRSPGAPGSGTVPPCA